MVSSPVPAQSHAPLSSAAEEVEADEAQNDFPQLKYALLGGVGLFLLIQKEQ